MPGLQRSLFLSYITSQFYRKSGQLLRPQYLQYILFFKNISSKKISDIIRWNTENKKLFGAIIKTPSQQKADGKLQRTKRNTVSKNKEMDEKTKQNLEEMFQISKSLNTAAGNNVQTDEWIYMYEGKGISLAQEDADVDVKTTPVDSVSDINKESKTRVAKRKLHTSTSKSVVSSSDVDFASDGVEYSQDSALSEEIHNHKILPIPKQAKKATSNNNSIKQNKSETNINYSQVKAIDSVSEEKENITPQFPVPKEMNFVLHCPLSPEDLVDVNESQQFKNLVDTFGLRMLPTVNTILTKTRPDLSNFFLQRWRENMTKELGPEGFKKHQEAIIWQGTVFHACVQQHLSGMEESALQLRTSEIQGYWSSLSSVLRNISDVQALETNVSHPWLMYKGTFDCIAKYNDTLYVIDWKTSVKAKPLLSNLYDNTLQVVAYLGAINSLGELRSKVGILKRAAIVIAYQNGEPAHIHTMNPAMCQHYWLQWCQRLHQFWGQVAAEKLAV